MTTIYTRRDLLKRGAAVAAAGTMLPVVGRVGAAVGSTGPDPSTALRNRLVLIYLAGGNDGLNTVVPTDDVPGAPRRSVYDQIRPGVGYARGAVLPLDRGSDSAHALGLNPKLPTLHRLYRDGRVAVVQGVGYTDYDLSHFTSTAIWQSGEPERAPDSGWVGRHLDRAGIGDGEVRAVAVERSLPLTLQGRDGSGVNINRIPLRFADGGGKGHVARHRAIPGFAAHPAADVLPHLSGLNAANTAHLVSSLEGTKAPLGTGNRLADALAQARILLEGNFGCEVVHVTLGGFDTHAAQRTLHESQLAALDSAINTFLYGDRLRNIAALKPEVASRTLIMTYSEFGRRIGQNGSAGTDHGAASPLFMIGPAGGSLIGGVHGDHPDMGSTLVPADNLMMTTPLQSVYQSVLTGWLGNPDPLYGDGLRLFT